MPRYKLTIAYDGTRFCGWQKQEPLAPAPADPSAPPSQHPSSEILSSTGKRLAYAPDTLLIPSDREGRVALRTVQGVLEQAVREVVREPVELLGASRTDSGVHARGQVAAFSCPPFDEELTSAEIAPPASAPPAEHPDVPPPSPPRRTGWPLARGAARLVAALNSRLPEDLLVLAAEPVAHDFDPISGARSKGYTYTFHVSPRRPLWDRHFVHHVWNPQGLDVAAMNAAAAGLVGEHDFAAFAAAGHGRLTTVRTIHRCEVVEHPAIAPSGTPSPDIADRRVVLHISSNGFLWNMVRIVAGTLMQVGLGQRTPADVRAALEGRDRAKSGPTLPPTGLCLEWIRYSDRADTISS